MSNSSKVRRGFASGIAFKEEGHGMPFVVGSAALDGAGGKTRHDLFLREHGEQQHR
ncbi:hypothetical protein At1D132_21910 [Agrobacterium fabrum]|nr:hypothetical protein At1D132_21910 [Agrobacterium fabrum]